MSNIVISVENAYMTYKMTEANVHSIKEYIIRFFKHDLKYVKFNALENISFSIEQGEVVGIIGENGAGKSTLLKLLSGILLPTKGSISVKGNIVPLLELGCGFDTELSGKENIYLNAAVLGYSKQFIEEKYNSIVEFSGLGPYINQPLRTYSSGMMMRLGFAIAAMVKPDILIIDEIFAVGDDKFQKKSKKKMEELMASGTTVLFVSHDINAVKQLCKRAIWLDHGCIKMDGTVEEVCNAYINR